MGTLFLTKEARIYNGAKTASSVNGAGKTRQLHVKDLLELTPKKDVLFIIGDWNAKVASQETPGVTGKFGLGIRNEAGQKIFAK